VLIGLTGSAGIVVAVLLGLLLGSGMLILFVWLWVKLGFVPAAIVLERASIRSSMSRSWRLTRGAFWRIFGTRLLVAAMLYVATQIITTPVALIFSLAGTVLQPNGATTAAASSSLVLSVIITQAVTAVIASVGLVVATATSALLYLDQRMRLEGLDLDLARFTERRQAGEHGLPDPFLPADSAASVPSSPAASGAV
jgi:membrane-anchored glycerophosphoryl diester phosphodiesterase (GDPDase)